MVHCHTAHKHVDEIDGRHQTTRFRTIVEIQTVRDDRRANMPIDPTVEAAAISIAGMNPLGSLADEPVGQTAN